MAPVLTVEDLPSAVVDAVDPSLLNAMVAGVNGQASRVAPCLAAADAAFGARDEARLILIGAVKRWAEAGSGAYQQQAAGPFSVTTYTRQRSGYALWPSEIVQLEALCRATGSGTSAYMLSLAGPA